MSARTIEKVIDMMNRKYAPETNRPYEKMTYEKLAGLMGVSKQTLLNWNEEPGKIPSEKMDKLIELSGLSYENLRRDDNARIPGPIVQEFYESKVSSINRKIEIGKRDLVKIEKFPAPTRGTVPFNNIKNKATTVLKNAISTTAALVRKPRICALGQSDSGKSTTVNYMLNETIVPASYTPMTSVICGLHYIGDRPEFLTGVDNAVVYGRRIINGEVQGDSVAYDDYHVYDKDKILCIGDHKSVLNAYATREGAYYKSDDICIDSIHIFLDNPLLKEADYYDVPGFGSGEVADDVSLSQKMYQSDIVLYLSQADAFLKGPDLKILADMLGYHGKENLRTVYVMATHSNAIGNPIELEKILDNGAKRLVETLGDEQLENIGISVN
ncbi:MAG: dynamin family protein, partial [Oribacterium sp.]|nr:dynamin family protein [Oribacterium sp.]